MEGKFQDKENLDQYLEEQVSSRGSQYKHGFFSEKGKQESPWIEGFYTEGETIIKQAPEG